MTFNEAIKLLGKIALALAMLGVGIISSMGACNYGFKTDGQAIFGWAGIANLVCWAVVIVFYYKKYLRPTTQADMYAKKNN